MSYFYLTLSQENGFHDQIAYKSQAGSSENIHIANLDEGRVIAAIGCEMYKMGFKGES